MSTRTDNFSDLSDFLNHFHNKYNKSGDTNVFSKKATLWKSILEPRKSLKKINESTLQSFLDPSTHLSSGTSDWKREIDNNLISYFIEKIPHSYLNNSLKVPYWQSYYVSSIGYIRVMYTLCMEFNDIFMFY